MTDILTGLSEKGIVFPAMAGVPVKMDLSNNVRYCWRTTIVIHRRRIR